MDRHRTMTAYQHAKQRIFRGCRKVVVNRDEPLIMPLLSADVEAVGWSMQEPEPGDFGLRQQQGMEYLCFGQDILMPASELRLFGRHNIANALAAMALGYSVGLPLSGMQASLRSFRGLPHRCELIANIQGVRFVNDSKGTNIGATEAALSGVGGDRDILLIAGGQGKGADFSQLQKAVSRHCKLLILLGEDALLLQKALSSCAAVRRVSSLDEAVKVAAITAEAGDVVLLSPACASFDMFSGYQQRGEAFSSLVNALLGRVQ
jgi:UDP-N-acetylmuramoylalanine--D-glutamate ligase